jgi:single-strand DNA-binding protein
MSDVNTATISGNLVRDPELRHTQNGTAVCNARLACSRSRKTDDGYTEETSFFSVTIWSGFGELIARKFRKGDKMVVSGRLQQREWEGENGKREAVEIVADQVTGEAMFRKDDQVPALQDGAAGQTSLEGAAAADDDIPF